MAGNRTLKLSILADVDDLRQKLNTADNDVQGFGGKLEKFGKAAAAAFAAAAAAAALYAGKLAIDGVKAAIEDEAAQTRLKKALEASTGATNDQVAAIEAQILKTSLATGVADDQLRPALQRLALATRDTQKAQDLLTLALDISASTGKPLEAVTNALGKAYEGNTGALAKLGVGIGAAELKSMGLAKATDELQKLFAGAASAQANTYEGKIARLKVAFDETKESVGAALLPILSKLLDFINNFASPALDKLNKAFSSKDGLTGTFEYFKRTYDVVLVPIWNGLVKGLTSIKDAIGDNLDAFKEFGGYIVTYLSPVIGKVMGGAIEFLGKVIGGLVDIVGGVVKIINSLISSTIDGINFLIRAYNAIPLVSDIPTIQKPNFSTPKVSVPSGATPTMPQVDIPTPTTTSGGGGGGSSTPSVSTPSSSTSSAAAALGAVVSGSFNAGSFRMADAASMNNVTVNIGVAGDPEATARTIVDVLNQSSYRGTGGGGGLVGIYDR